MATDEHICQAIYAAAAAAEPTGDLTQWPDVLAFRYPLVHVKPLLHLMGIIDPDLRQTIIAAVELTRIDTPEDVRAVANVINAAIETQTRRLAG